jgi:hypothetical protein
MNVRRFVASTLVTAICLNAGAFARSAPEVRLADGTRIAVRLMHPLSSETAQNGDPITFEIAEDVVVDDQVVIRQGTPVKGVVVESAAKRRMGRAGNLSYTLTETRTVDRQVVRLRAGQQKKGDSHVTGVAVTTTAVGVFVPVAAPFFLLRKGKDVTIPQGTRVDAFVDGEHVLRPAAAALIAASTDPAPQPAATSGAKLTNTDIVKLKAAGFGDDVIVATVETSPNDFNLGAPALVALKQGGVSDRVISAMLKSRRE